MQKSSAKKSIERKWSPPKCYEVSRLNNAQVGEYNPPNIPRLILNYIQKERFLPRPPPQLDYQLSWINWRINPQFWLEVNSTLG